MHFPRGVKTLTLLVALGAVCLGLAVGVVNGQGGRTHTAALASSNQASPPGQVWHASMKGSGTACSGAAPCTAEAALRRAKPGDRVALAAGSYPKLTITSTAQRATAENPVVVQPADGADVRIAGLSLQAPGITVQNLDVTATAYVYPTSTGTTLRNLHVNGGGVFLRANGSRLLDSLVENGRCRRRPGQEWRRNRRPGQRGAQLRQR